MYSLRTIVKALGSRQYRQRVLEKRRLGALPRYHPTITKVLDKHIQIVDPGSFLLMSEEIFGRQTFQFSTDHPEPFIIDAGANIGLATIYFKQLYPSSHVLAFEPDPAIFEVLSKNVSQLGLQGVELINRALWKSCGTMQFWSEGSWSGRLASNGDAPNTEVKSVRLGDYIQRPVQFLKMDIEGAEIDVLEECACKLHFVERLFLEYHSFADQPQRIETLFQILASAGFRVQIHPEFVADQPFVQRKSISGFDFQMKVFAFRE
jgi:FkbM family methyltransferase